MEDNKATSDVITFAALELFEDNSGLLQNVY